MPSAELPLGDGWEVAAAAPDAHADPSAIDALAWLPARVPGTAAGALRDAGRPLDGDLDAQDWWFRTRFAAEPAAEGEELLLRLGGIATVAEVFLDGARVLESDSMLVPHVLDVGARLSGGGEHELAIRCRALAPLLARQRKPRARWRTRLVADGNLRWFRTTVLGRAPGFAPGPAPVGPWRPVRLERRSGAWVEELALRARMEGDDGVLAVRARVRGSGAEPVEVELRGRSGTHRTALAVGEDGIASGELRVPSVARWWPHTHGEPVLHDVTLRAGGRALATRRAGFRALAPGSHPDHDVERDGLDLHVNGVRVFARGAVWTPVDAVGLAPGPAALRATLERARDAGMNLLRIPGIGLYESPAFHDLCDELGLLVWQELAFANMDYPVADPAFRASVEREATALLAELAGRPSTAVVCGNSEVEQQVAMLGLDPALGRGELFGTLLPGLLAAAETDAIWVPSTPCGGALPFRPDRGIANYYGVGGYRRPLEDARRAAVRFAAECLALSNVPDTPHAALEDPRWKAGVPRDHGSAWDFEDVRDHYLALLYGAHPVELRRAEPERYLALSRAVSGELMAEVLGEWRRTGSPCGGALVLWLRDLAPGAGWGVLDHEGVPKAAYHHLRRALAPVAVWTTDEGLGGIAVHVANDRPLPLRARLRVALYRDGEVRVEQATEELALPAHGACTRDAEGLIGRFADASYAYRFGPPGHDVVLASLEDADGTPLAQAFRFPAGRPLTPEPPQRLGLEAELRAQPGGAARLELRSRRVAYGVRVHAPGFDADDDALTIEPGGRRTLRLTPRAPGAALAVVELSALNLRGRVRAAVAP